MPYKLLIKISLLVSFLTSFKKMKKTLVIKGVLFSLFQFSGALAGEYNYGIFSTAELSDNIAETSDKSVGHSIDTGVNFLLGTDSNREFVGTLEGGFSHETYSESDIDNQIYKRLSGLLLYRPATNNFSLRVLDELSQMPQNRFSTIDLGNYRDSNVFSINPEYFVRLNPRHRINLSADFIRTKDEDVVTETGRLVDASKLMKVGAASLQRELSRVSTLSLVYESIDNDFDADISDGAIDYIQDDILLRWVIRGSATRLQIEVGQSTLVDEFDNEERLVLREVSISRQINHLDTLEFYHRHGFNNILNINFTNDSVSVQNTANSLLTAQTVTENTIAYNIISEHLNLAFSLFHSNIDGVFDDSEEASIGLSLEVSYPVSRLFDVSTNADLSFTYSNVKNKFYLVTQPERENHEQEFQLNYNYFFNQTTTLFAYFLHRRNSEAAIGNSDFDVSSNMLGFGFSYAPSGRL